MTEFMIKDEPVPARCHRPVTQHEMLHHLFHETHARETHCGGFVQPYQNSGLGTANLKFPDELELLQVPDPDATRMRIAGHESQPHISQDRV
jgi:hypothetical protein